MSPRLWSRGCHTSGWAKFCARGSSCAPARKLRPPTSCASRASGSPATRCRTASRWSTTCRCSRRASPIDVPCPAERERPPVRSDSWVQTARSTVAQARAIAQSPLFAGLAMQQIEQVLYLTQLREFHANAALYRAGDPGDRLWVIVRGVVHEHAPAPDGTGPVVGKRRRGDVVGATSILTGESRTGTMVATIPTQALEFRRDDFGRVLQAHPSVLLNLTRILSRRLVAATAQQAPTGDGELGEAVALFLGETLADSVEEILAATRAASPGSVGLVDARERLEEAVGGLDEFVAGHRTVLFVA